MQVMQMASSTDLKTAEVIRLTITPSVLDLADELTECHDGKSSGLILLTIESGSVRCSVLAPKRRLVDRVGWSACWGKADAFTPVPRPSPLSRSSGIDLLRARPLK